MKPLQFLPFCLLLAQSTRAADQQTLNADLTQATTPQISFEDHLLSSDAAAEVRSVVLRHIANVTAQLAEEYLKDLVTSGMVAFGINGSASHLKSHSETTGKQSDMDGVVAPEEGGPPQPSANEPGFNLLTGNNETTRVVGLLPPSWPLMSTKLPVPASCPCNCNNPTTPCCIKICVNHSKLRTDQPPSVSTAEAEGSDHAQAMTSNVETEVGTKQISEPQTLASCPCNCNNPTTTCCIKICVNHLKALLDQQPLISTVVSPEPHQGPGELVDDGAESDIEQIAKPLVRTSCPCNCNNPRTPCCIKICVNHFKAHLDQLLPISAATVAGSNQAQGILSNTTPGVSVGAGIEDFGQSRADTVDAGIVTLKTSLGSHLAVKAEFDLDLYASFVSQNLVRNLGFTAQVHTLASNETSTVVIKDEIYRVIGTVPIAVEAYTRKNFAFEDLFYVIEPSQEVEGVAAPELVFGIDHVRQAEGLALKANFLD